MARILMDVMYGFWVTVAFVSFARNYTKPEGKMGFKSEEVQYNLKWADEEHELHGLEILIKSLTVRKFNEMMRQGIKNGEEGLEANEWIMKLLAEKIVKWNWQESDGSPKPVSLDSILDTDRRHINFIIRAWQMSMVGIPDDLGKALRNGDQSVEESLGLASSSQNLSN